MNNENEIEYPFLCQRFIFSDNIPIDIAKKKVAGIMNSYFICMLIIFVSVFLYLLSLEILGRINRFEFFILSAIISIILVAIFEKLSFFVAKCVAAKYSARVERLSKK